MLQVLYEDRDILVTVKPAGYESQAAKGFARDMVSEVRKHLVINKRSTPGKEPYVGVIHRLDKPVSGIMVYGLTKEAAAGLSDQIRQGEFRKTYQAVICGKPGKIVDNYVDYLKKSVDGNMSKVVEMGITGAKRAELSYECVKTIETEEGVFSLLTIHLKTGRHHQIRVQMAAHGLPLYGDRRYFPSGEAGDKGRNIVGSGAGPALCASALSFTHPSTKKKLSFSITPSGGIFEKFFQDV